MADEQYGCGALPLTPDLRDWSALRLPAIAQAVHGGTAPTVRLGGQIGGYYDQGVEGACVAYSEAGVVSREETIAGRPWVWLDAEDLYRRNGGTGGNGIDTRASLADIVKNGIKRRDGGPPIREAGYLFVPKQAGLWEATIMAALSVGKAVTLATYLPQNFGWDSSGPPDPTRYHQIYLDAGDPNWWEIVNSWGPNWGSGGRGRLLKSFVDPLRPDVYAYVIDPGTAPAPPPPPPPARLTTVTGTANYPRAEELTVGKTMTLGSGGTIFLTRVIRQEGDPQPPPPPSGLRVEGMLLKGVYLTAIAYSGTAAVKATLTATVAGVDLGARESEPIGSGARPGVWELGHRPAGTALTVDATAADGRTGRWTGTT